jgi:glycolate oxidase FAD binding subunit
VLDTRGHSGIVGYEPTELVITARGGTPLAEVEAALAAQGQFLPFEPPSFGSSGGPGAVSSPLPMGEGLGVRAPARYGAGPHPPALLPEGEGSVVFPSLSGREIDGLATIGGVVAAGLSGPRRAAAGAVRDFVLGVKLMDGEARVLSFGGQVMKNVAGYDVSRLIAGSLGTLGVILEVSLKVLPRPVTEATLRFERPEAKALESVNRWAGKPLAVSATCWCDNLLTVRLSGARAAVESARETLGGEAVADAAAAAFWADLREHRLDFFTGDEPLWRLSVPTVAAPLRLPGRQLVEWGGAQRWLRSSAAAASIREIAVAVGGHATLFRSGSKEIGVFQPLPPSLMNLHRRVKAAFDPRGILNPGRLYPDF